MEEIAAALRELVQTNRQIVQQNQLIVEKLSGIQTDLASDREERLARKQFKAKAFREMDIQYIMKHKSVGAAKAAERLEEHGDGEDTVKSD
ncbi:uncharacterized protein [Fopius arisanus]|uniref:Uncharacterized protein isoform X2 n=1 Tax=Fopius arisanus TaxID=64838 RepID=A0A9R1THK4_9HYME|nr:PREDICTED: uncharacterized protein LOC105271052 isoform X2 [Fopius arisanus]